MREGEYIVFKCLSCSLSGDIFKACSLIEGKPTSGKEWVGDNVLYLADLLEEAHSCGKVEIDPERQKLLRLYEDAADCLVGLVQTSKTCDGFQHTSTRGLSREVCLDYGVGTVNWKEYFETLQRYGPWDPDYITDAGLGPDIFNDEFITITIRDHRGQAVGFDRRFVYYNKDEFHRMVAEGKHPHPKFKNSVSSHGSLGAVAKGIWDENPLFYGLNKCKSLTWRKLDIVEGPFDVLSAVQAGHQTIVGAFGTTRIKDKHLDLLEKIGFTEVRLIMDGDEAGRKAANSFLEKFGKRPTPRLSFVNLGFREEDEIPVEERDPDTFFRLYCKEDLKNFEMMPTFSAFLYTLQQARKRGVRTEALVREVIPTIAVEADSIERGKMIRDLAKDTGVHEDDIREEVRKIRSGVADEIIDKMNRKLDTMKDTTPSAIKEVLRDTLDEMSGVSKSRLDLLSSSAALANIHSAFDEFDNDQGALAGWRTNIPLIDDVMFGLQKSNYWVIGGNPNTGKSQWAHSIVHGLLQSYAQDQVIVLHTLDDPIGMAIAKQISVDTGFDIKDCARPQSSLYENKERAAKYMETRDFYLSMVPHRLRIYGGEAGSTISTIETSVKRAEDETGNNVILIIDSFHLLKSDDGAEDRARYEKNSEKLHAMMHGGTTVIVTAECSKSSHGRRPRYSDLSETRGLAYDATVVAMIYNENHEKDQKSRVFWVDESGPEVVKQDVVVVNIEKNKSHGGAKGEAYFRTWKGSSRMRQISHPLDYIKEQIARYEDLGFVIKNREGGSFRNEAFAGLKVDYPPNPW